MLHDSMTGRDSGQCFFSCPALSCPVVPWPALSSALLRATEWLQWNVMTTDWTKPCIHGPPSHSGSLRLGALITEWGGGQSPSTPRLSCQTRVAHPRTATWLPVATSATHLSLQHFIWFSLPHQFILQVMQMPFTVIIQQKTEVECSLLTSSFKESQSKAAWDVSCDCLADLMNEKHLVRCHREKENNYLCTLET